MGFSWEQNGTKISTELRLARRVYRPSSRVRKLAKDVSEASKLKYFFKSSSLYIPKTNVYTSLLIKSRMYQILMVRARELLT